MTSWCWFLVGVLAFIVWDTLVFVLWLPYEYQERKRWCLLPGGSCVGCVLYAWRRYKALRNRRRAFNAVGITDVELRASNWRWWLVR